MTITAPFLVGLVVGLAAGLIPTGFFISSMNRINDSILPVSPHTIHSSSAVTSAVAGQLANSKSEDEAAHLVYYLLPRSSSNDTLKQQLLNYAEITPFPLVRIMICDFYSASASGMEGQ